MKNIIPYILFPVIILLYACDGEADIEFVRYEPKIVVEGIIENGRPASVVLSISGSISGDKDTLSLLNNVIRSAKVTVSDGETEDILIFRTNRDKLPPYEYYGSSIYGKPGQTYKLKVEYDGKIITSTTRIPEPVPLDSIWFRQEIPGDTIGYLNVRFRNTSDEYYQVATADYNSEAYFMPCLYGNIDSRVYPKDSVISMQINKGPRVYPKTSYETYFKTTDIILLRFATQTKDAYDFWTSYQNEILNTQNPIFPAQTSLLSNIEGDAIGIWTGIASYIYFIKIVDL